MNALQLFIKSKPCGFLHLAGLAELIRLDRLCSVLIRCGNCRLTCPAQDVQHLIDCVTAGGDYVRDLSFPVGALERAAAWKPEPAPFQCECGKPGTWHGTAPAGESWLAKRAGRTSRNVKG